MRLGERGRPGCQAAVHLVGADVQEAKALAFTAGKGLPIHPCGLQQVKRAFDVGSHEGRGSVDAAVDMALGGEVDERARPMLSKQSIDQLAVTNVTAHEAVTPVAVE